MRHLRLYRVLTVPVPLASLLEEHHLDQLYGLCNTHMAYALESHFLMMEMLFCRKTDICTSMGRYYFYMAQEASYQPAA
jgi:hypothetical protein